MKKFLKSMMSFICVLSLILIPIIPVHASENNNFQLKGNKTKQQV